MSLTPERVAVLIDAIGVNKIVDYAAVATITVVWADHMHTLPLEIKHMWTRRITFAKVLYFLTRYYLLVHSMLWVTYHANEDLTGKLCEFPFARNSVSSQVTLVLCEAISYIRVYAFSGRNKWLLAFLSVGFVAVNVVTFYYLQRFIKSVSFLDLPPDARLGCFPGKADGFALTVIESTLLLSLTIATLIMICIAIRRRRVMGGKNRLLQIFYQDGIFYFISISILAVMNIFIFLLAPGNGIQLLVVQPQVHFSALLATRMLLHLREWSAKQSVVMITTEVTLDAPNLHFRKSKLTTEAYALSDFTVYTQK
ncbi:hypothetical protein FA13DRAFT_223877 [Coprinellus micaceus]|uniref:DUF6533 domain-containing protein n=1 Tax=Coprinellus micaceus TaxID=71717 RepID=A0A4Y7TEX8_COPMI|nr:hypothetical protein FA13DRAFT_223877 [Coprinellus micaceus]